MLLSLCPSSSPFDSLLPCFIPFFVFVVHDCRVSFAFVLLHYCVRWCFDKVVCHWLVLVLGFAPYSVCLRVVVGFSISGLVSFQCIID